ncbi:hypothetical protein OAA91_01700 [Fibrobacterales bacterium]|nr:hypothetical protein [Fibrobacterales bacterium]
MQNTFVILKKIVQLALVGPTWLYFPISLPLGIFSLFNLVGDKFNLIKDNELIEKVFVLNFGWIGLLSLFVSIILPQKMILQYTILKYLITTGIVIGIISVILLKPWSIDEYFSIWLLGGPSIVALWNLFEFYKK